MWKRDFGYAEVAADEPFCVFAYFIEDPLAHANVSELFHVNHFSDSTKNRRREAEHKARPIFGILSNAEDVFMIFLIKEWR